MFIIRMKYRDSIKGALQSCRVCPMELTTFQFKTFAGHYALENEWACVFHAQSVLFKLLPCHPCHDPGLCGGRSLSRRSVGSCHQGLCCLWVGHRRQWHAPRNGELQGTLGITKHTFSVKMCVATTPKKHGMMVSFFHSQQVLRSLGVGNF